MGGTGRQGPVRRHAPALFRNQERPRGGRRSLFPGTAAGPALPYEVAEAARKNPVTLYTSSNCSPCDTGRTMLTSRGVPFRENGEHQRGCGAPARSQRRYPGAGTSHRQAQAPGVCCQRMDRSPDGSRLPHLQQVAGLLSQSAAGSRSSTTGGTGTGTGNFRTNALARPADTGKRCVAGIPLLGATL